MQPSDYDYSFSEKRQIERYLAEAEKDTLIREIKKSKNKGRIARLTLPSLILPRNSKVSQFK